MRLYIPSNSLKANRVISGNMCDAVHNKKLCFLEECQSCYDKSAASLNIEPYWSERNSKPLRQIFSGSAKKYYFDCHDCGHTFHTMMSQIKFGYWCPYPPCNSIYLCDDEECQTCFEHSAASLDKAEYWSDENTLPARKVFKRSNKKVKHNCDKCDHSFMMSPDLVSQGFWCSYCSGKLLCEDLDCTVCHEKSFASIPFSTQWSPNNSKTARQVFKRSNLKFLFICEKCDHEFKMAPDSITGQKQGCPYCNSSKMCLDEKCVMCFNKSFASSAKAQFWSAGNKKTPREVCKNTHTKYTFVCEENHEFSTRPNFITSNNSWCPVCKNKTEKILYAWLKQRYPDVVFQKKFDWCINPTTGKHKIFDYYIPSLNKIVELDGGQHFEQVKCWGTLAYTQQSDLYKNITACCNNMTLLRLLQTDVFRNANECDTKLQEHLDAQHEACVILLYDDPIICHYET